MRMLLIGGNIDSGLWSVISIYQYVHYSVNKKQVQNLARSDPVNVAQFVFLFTTEKKKS